MSRVNFISGDGFPEETFYKRSTKGIFISFCLLLIILLFNSGLKAQQSSLFKTDTVSINIADAEQRFVSKSLSLVAAKFEIDISQANVLQAKQYYNPNLTYFQQLYSPAPDVYFDNSIETGNVDWQVNQLFSIAGKHVNTVKLAKLEVEKSKLLYDEVVRSLKYELYTSFANLLAAQQKAKLLEYEVSNLDALLKGEEQQLNLGAISGNEVIRLKTEKQNLLNDALANEADMLEAQKELKQLLNYSYNTYLSVQDITPANSALPPFEQVLSSAEKNRPDLMLANTEVKYQAQNLKLQKSTAVPDLNLGINYTRRSSYVLNYYGIGATMDLPVFNRNQGNIKMARYQLEEAKVNDTITSNEVKNEIANSYVTLYKIKARLDGIDKTKNDKDIEQLVTNGVTNYQKKYISQLEFLDQLRAYKDAKFGMIDLNSDYFKAIQYLNFTAGTTILK